MSRISPQWAPYIVLAVPLLGVLAFALQWLPRLPTVRLLLLAVTGWDPAAVPEDGVSRRAMALIDQLQEEVKRYREMIDHYDGELVQLLQVRLSMVDHMNSLRDQAVTARVMVHSLERRLGLAETEFAPLPPLSPTALGPDQVASA